MAEINRSLIILNLKQPFLDWAQSLDDEDKNFTLEDLREDSTAYLLPEGSRIDFRILIETSTAGAEARTRAAGKKLIFFDPLFSILTKSLRKNVRACAAYRACIARFAYRWGTFGGQYVSCADEIAPSGSSEWLVGMT